ncbi:ATP-binding cassette domain-containing protein [uncultured Umboniibacter sp.]|uniref:ATP-binding cassette domain-containing protein n=1 Tax=uncultured Umboniibacter sp. TaxID=1798917 RepID=UPI002605DAAC|nr:ATP-binding cassette domain-containing protein [uncultured Umboniibacter sp.]
MIQITAANLQRGEKSLLENASLRINTGHKIALIGANGAGKTTLFKLLMGELTVDQGDCHVPRAWTIAHMAQEHPETDAIAVDYVVDGDVELRLIEAQLKAAETNDDGPKIASAHAELERIEGYGARNRAEKLLHGLGFAKDVGERTVTSYSGGWRMRLNLARALMCRSDLLLLDEPTNHLDLDTIIWLQDWLRAYEGTLILISHDRDFIDAVADHIVALEQRQLTSYRGNYSAYERQKAERMAQQQAIFEKQQRRKKEIESFVARFRYKATKARQAQSRLKELQRMEDIAPAHADSPFHFRIPCHDKISSPLLNLDEVDAGYTSATVFNKLNFAIQPGQRVGLLGVNGAGKSTLIKTLVGELPKLSGDIISGEHTRVGYFAQQQLDALELDQSCFDHIRTLSPNAPEAEVRNFLGGFNFQGDRVFEAIEPFSGGEKTRLALALVVWQTPNLLILDEPTNHLDLEVRHALTVALQTFEGAVLLVSHDRHLLANTVDEYWLVADGKVAAFDGDLSDYSRWLKQREADASPAIKSVAPAVDKKQARQEAANRRAQLAPLRKQQQKLEKQIEQLEERLAEIEGQLGDPSIYSDTPALAQELSTESGKIRVQLEDVEASWLDVLEQLEAAE